MDAPTLKDRKASCAAKDRRSGALKASSSLRAFFCSSSLCSRSARLAALHASDPLSEPRCVVRSDAGRR